MPLFASGAGVTRAGEREQALVNGTDLYATIAELAGASVTLPADSQSFAGTLLAANASPRTFNYSEIEGSGDSGWTTRDATHKLIVYSDGSEELYDHDNDPNEWHNLAHDPSLNGIKDEHAEWIDRLTNNQDE